MKLQGGYLPRVPGRPSAAVRDIAVPERLVIPLNRHGLQYTPAINDGDAVSFGVPLAWAETAGGRVALPAPASGVVAITPAGKNSAPCMTLQVTDAQVKASGSKHTPERMDPQALRQALAAGGIWPLIRSSKTGGMPVLDGSETPARIMVSFVAAEPFRTCGNTVLAEARERVLAGLRVLPRLMTDSGILHLVLTDPTDAAFQAVRAQTAGDARVRIEQAPLRYPVEHPRVLCRALRRGDRTLKPDDVIWVLDVQAVQAIGACLAEGLPLHERVIAVGGPGLAAPGHVRARIGTPLAFLLPPEAAAGNNLILRGGLFQGVPVEPAATAIDAHDDAFFVLSRLAEREFLGFVTPGFDRVSFLPIFGTALTGSADRHLTASLRGERRPCVACGLCEQVCPMALLPQMIHRYLYRDALDEAQSIGLDLCIGCGLCAYVCPSKIELRQQFADAQARLREERAHTAAAHREHQEQLEKREQQRKT